MPASRIDQPAEFARLELDELDYLPPPQKPPTSELFNRAIKLIYQTTKPTHHISRQTHHMSILTHDMSRQTLYLLVLGQLSHSARSSFQLLSLVLLLGFKLHIHLTGGVPLPSNIGGVAARGHSGGILAHEVSPYMARLEVSL